MFTVKSIVWHTSQGQTHEVGDVYEVETFEEAENLRVLKFAELVEATPPSEPEQKGDTSVSPMTTEDVK